MQTIIRAKQCSSVGRAQPLIPPLVGERASVAFTRARGACVLYACVHKRVHMHARELGHARACMRRSGFMCVVRVPMHMLDMCMCDSVCVACVLACLHAHMRVC
eukprot:5023467-Pleurochrysis_carterae.AAC.2